MKEIIFKAGKVIRTPWLRIEEAAAYCGLSRSAFTDHARTLPHSGNDRTRLYNVKTLDAWLNGSLDIPFDPDKKPATRHRSYRKPETDSALVDPVSGKIFKSRL